MNETLTLGYALCGSFCTFEKSLQALEALSGRYANIIPIFSEASATLDTRFGRATEHIARAEQICGRPALRSLITILQEAQAIYGYLPEDVIYHVAARTGNSPARTSVTIMITSATSMAISAWRRINSSIWLSVDGSMPPVSIRSKVRPFQSHRP